MARQKNQVEAAAKAALQQTPNGKLDESLGERDGSEATKDQSQKDRRNEARAEADTPPTLDRYYGKGPGKNYMGMPGGYSYRLYDDGSIEIIGAPGGRGVGFSPKKGGPAYEAIFKQVTQSAPVTPSAPTTGHVAPEEARGETNTLEKAAARQVDPALESMAKTMPTYIGDEEHAKALQEGFQKTLPLEALAEQAAKDAPAEIESLSSATAVDIPSKRGFTPWPSDGLERLGRLTMQAARKALGQGE